MRDLKAVDALCIRYDMDVLGVVADAENDEHTRGLYARLAIAFDYGWFDYFILDDLRRTFEDYHEIETKY